jgi:hypothetical protein
MKVWDSSNIWETLTNQTSINEGKVNMELQLDATITVFIDLLDQLNMFRLTKKLKAD